MTSELIYQLKEAKCILEKDYGITEIAIFGSYARGEETETSDIDIAIIKMNRKNGFLVARAKNFLEDYFKKNIDIGLYDSMNPYIKKEIEVEMIYV